MIGGIDIPVASNAGRSALEAAVRAIRLVWHHAVFEDGETGVVHTRFSRVPFGSLSEVFVYRDPESAALWDRLGAVDETWNSMIHLIAESGRVTIVVDELAAELPVIVEAIRGNLRDELFSVLATRNAA